MRSLRGILLGLALAAVAPAHAQTVAASAAQWGILGTWALQCGAPVSRANAYLTYRAEGDRVVHDRDFGDTRDSFPVDAVTILPDGTVKLRVNFNTFNQVREWAMFRAPDGRIRVVWNQAVGGDFSVKDSRNTKSGTEMPWQTRCK
jgi:hypothetical protein